MEDLETGRAVVEVEFRIETAVVVAGLGTEAVVEGTEAVVEVGTGTALVEGEDKLAFD